MPKQPGLFYCSGVKVKIQGSLTKKGKTNPNNAVFWKKKLKFNIDVGLKFDTPPKCVPFHDRYTIRRGLKAATLLETNSSLLKIVRGPLKRKFNLPTIGFQGQAVGFREGIFQFCGLITSYSQGFSSSKSDWSQSIHLGNLTWILNLLISKRTRFKYGNFGYPC